MFSAIISDLDGTLLNDRHRISARTATLLHHFRQQGTELVLATGRHAMDVEQILTAAGLSAWRLTCNGARVQTPDGHLMLSRNLPDTLMTTLTQRLLDEPQLSVHLYTDHCWYYSSQTGGQDSFAEDMLLPRCRFDRNSLPSDPVIKLFCCCQDTALLASLQTQLTREFGRQLSVTCSFPWCMEIMAVGVSKGWALSYLARQRGWQLDDCVAFGDGMNDLEMLQAVGRSVLVANADARLGTGLPRAEHTCSNVDQGVAVWLERQLASSLPTEPMEYRAS
ncbi:MAG: Cof-type HAD-IIB family hydrolase [Kistimonas sp.]|nr:Cof-type HAD-IIB family hydrolase [Kistimonas sp.]